MFIKVWIDRIVSMPETITDVLDLTQACLTFQRLVETNGGPLPIDQAIKSMDNLYRRFGFSLDNMGNYFLALNRTCIS